MMRETVKLRSVGDTYVIGLPKRIARALGWETGKVLLVTLNERHELVVTSADSERELPYG